ncbi:amidohydrolase family protein [Nitrososphaera sp.]|uniref:dihydroorotase n=1 Tax=Nitrososphaera sp. TaxID=1971748 RepID=UPI0017C8EDED|nr:amidohydrolase family protein [Nitrososphaera sp.]NWG37846.1 amidohydrolase family protein [Nitrososphaera sp.]
MQNSCDVLVTNAQAVVPKAGVVETNILIEDGRIKALEKSAENVQASRRINAAGRYVLPGAIDPHVHYGVYTPIEEAARTESRSAAVGGVTTMVRMLRLYDDSYRAIEKQLQASKGSHYIDYAIHASILKKEQVKDIPYLKSIGVNSLKIYMNLGADLNHIYMDLDPGEHRVKDGEVNMDDSLLSSIVKQGARAHSTVLVHAEDPAVCAEHIRRGRETKMSGLKAWSDCRPPSSEAASVAKISEIGRKFGASLYFVHIGSNAAIDAILNERQKGKANYYIETCPQYLTHTFDFDSLKGKVVPPIRSKSDVQSVWSALRNGVIDTIGTDHVANRLDMKMGDGDLWSALAGFPGIATMIPVLLHHGVNQDRIGIERVAELTSYNTARILGMYPKKGAIQPGSDADLVIVDMDLEQKVTPELLQSYSDYTIYDGQKMKGWPVLTMVRGKVVMEDGKVAGDALGHGQFVKRPA